MRHNRALPRGLTLRHTPRLYNLLAAAPLLLGAVSLAGCQSKTRQDVFTTPTATCAAMMPTVSGTRTYTPRQTEAQSEKQPPNSVVAYPDPETPAFCDRPLSDTLPTSIELADYTRGLSATNLLPTLQRKGPYTVFAIPNAVLEHYAAQIGGNAFAPEQHTAFYNLLAYSIVPGHWLPEQLRAGVNAAPSHILALATLAGHPLYVQLEPRSGQLVVGNGEGVTSRLWVNGIPQANGVLYFVQSLVPPPTHVATPALQAGNTPLAAH